MLFFHSLGFPSRILRIWVCMDHVDVLYIYIYIFTWFIAQGLMLGKRLNIFAICFLPFVSF